MNKENDYRHLVNVYKCDAAKLERVNIVQEGLDCVLHEMKPTSTNFFYQFTPKGVTGLYLWPKGHLSIHTWPEREMAALDVVGYPYNNKNLMKKLQDAFPAYYVPVQCTSAIKKGTPRVGQEVYGTLGSIKNLKRLEEKKDLLELLKDISASAHFKVIGEVARSDDDTIDAAVILSESHFSVHYSPKRKEIVVDIFTCGKEGDPHLGYEFLKRELDAQEVERVEVRR